MNRNFPQLFFLLSISVVGVSAVAAAQTAPSQAAGDVGKAPIDTRDFRRPCPAYGPGFSYIPGTNTCVYVGGYVRAEAQYTPSATIYSVNPSLATAAFGAVTQKAGAQENTGVEIRGRIDVDARTPTEWGTVQTVVWIRGTVTDGLKALSSGSALTSAISAGSYSPGGNPATSVTMERAYVRFAGLTAGVGPENFTSLPVYMYVQYPFASFTNGAKQFAYTADFGAGRSATLAIESRGDYNYSNGVNADTYFNTPQAGYNLVGNVREDASWGYVELAGAGGYNTARTNLPSIPNSVTLANLPSYSSTTDPSYFDSYAVSIAGRVIVPFFSERDEINSYVSYGHGLLGLVGCGQGSDCSDATEKRMLGGVLRFDQNLIPVSISGTPGAPDFIQFGSPTSVATTTEFTHHFSPNWRTNLAIGYQQIDEPKASNSVGVQLGNANIYMAGTNLIFSPTPGFDIGLEFDYMRMSQSLQNATAANVGTGANNVSAAWLAAGSPGLSVDNYSARIRFERLF